MSKRARPGKSPARNSRAIPKKSFEERICHILDQLRDRGELWVQDLSNALGVTPAQIRKDIDWLSERVRFRRTYGGGTLAAIHDPYEGYYGVKSRRHIEGKHQVAGFAVERFIGDGDHLLLDGGTQVEAFVEVCNGTRQGIRAISHSASLALHFLKPRVNGFLQLGGVLDERTAAFGDNHDRFGTGDFFFTHATEVLRRFCHGGYKAIVTGTAFSCEKGVAVTSQSVIEYKRAIINAASEVIILLDHSKFTESARQTVTFCGLVDDDANGKRKSDEEWLEEDKPAHIVVEGPWKNNKASRDEAPEEFLRLRSDRGIHELPLRSEERKKYPTVYLFQTTLRGKKKRKS
jgi:DeoR/GlpR family transcriptional regulator of sugar metabolism